MELSYLHTASVSPLTKGLLSSFHPWGKLHCNSSWLPWLPGYLSHDDTMKWPNPKSLPLSSLIYTFSGQWGATPFNLIDQLVIPLTNGGLGELDITMYHFAHQHGIVDAKEGHDITFPILTPLCVWFWGVVIQGHGASSHDLQAFL